jgi:hypothetical protein
MIKTMDTPHALAVLGSMRQQFFESDGIGVLLRGLRSPITGIRCSCVKVFFDFYTGIYGEALVAARGATMLLESACSSESPNQHINTLVLLRNLALQGRELVGPLSFAICTVSQV